MALGELFGCWLASAIFGSQECRAVFPEGSKQRHEYFAVTRDYGFERCS